MTQVASSINSLTGIPRVAQLSSDGNYGVALGGVFTLLRVLSFPSRNIIKNNTCYGNSGGSLPNGVGIAGSSGDNLIIGNVCYNNPINPFMVYTNYAFVTNTFDQLFGDAPTLLQNIQGSSTDPILTPFDIDASLQRSLSKACDIQTKVDALLVGSPL